MTLRSPLWLTDNADQADAILDAIAWGYPREITDRELEVADWFRFGEGCVYWFEPVSNESAGFHISIRADQRGRVYPRSLFSVVRTSACLFGYKTLLVLRPPEKVAEYLGRMGLDSQGEFWLWPVRERELFSRG